MSAKSRESGFTLFETIVALAIGVAASAAMLMFVRGASVPSAQAHAAADVVASHLRAARNTAIVKRRPVSVSLGVAENPSLLVVARGTGGAGSGVPLAFPLVIPAGVEIQGWSATVTFDAAGRADRSLDLTIGADGREYRLQLFQASGLLSVRKL